MTSTARTFQRICCALLGTASILGCATAHARPLATGITDPLERGFGEQDPDGAYEAARAAGATVVRVAVFWHSVAPTAPADAGDPNDPAYVWASLDDHVRRIVAAGMEPLLYVNTTPLWGRRNGRLAPRPGDFAAFMTAVARRYDGTVRERVHYFQAWNEPNLKTYLDPDTAPEDYRAMLAAAYPAIHAVHEDNVVVAAGTGPFAGPNGRYGVGPLKFMRELFSERTEFDVWAHHPYTSGPPARHAGARDDVSIGDMPAMRRLLRSAKRAGRIRSTRIWATELSWDSAPPDPFAVPEREHGRWVAEGLYRMWREGVELVVWFMLRDNPKGTFTWAQTWQSGLYFRTTPRYAAEKAKPALRAFRFPFVALPSGGSVMVWGRTPGSAPGRVVVEHRVRGSWRRLTTLHADGDGIFRSRLARRGSAPLRARAAGDISLPFAPRRTKNRFVNPFGGASLPANG